MPKNITKKSRAKNKTSARRKTKVEKGAGNVFLDLGLPNPEEAFAKAQLAHQINSAIAERKLTQVNAAKLLGIRQPRVSELRRGRFGVFSMERLLEFARILGNDVEISLRPSEQPRLSVRIEGHTPSGAGARP